MGTTLYAAQFSDFVSKNCTSDKVGAAFDFFSDVIECETIKAHKETRFIMIEFKDKSIVLFTPEYNTILNHSAIVDIISQHIIDNSKGK